MRRPERELAFPLTVRSIDLCLEFRMTSQVLNTTNHLVVILGLLLGALGGGFHLLLVLVLFLLFSVSLAVLVRRSLSSAGLAAAAARVLPLPVLPLEREIVLHLKETKLIVISL